MKRKIWLFLALVLLIMIQLTMLSSFFHPFQTQGITYSNSIVEVTKMSYVSGWVLFDFQGASQQFPTTIQFTNGTQINITSEYKFEMNLPTTGDCYCDAETSLYGTSVSINESQPIVAAIVYNASSFEINSLPKSGTSIDGGLFDFYWFVVQGDVSVSVNGYGLSY